MDLHVADAYLICQCFAKAMSTITSNIAEQDEKPQNKVFVQVAKMVFFSCRSRSCKAHLMQVAWLHIRQC